MRAVLCVVVSDLDGLPPLRDKCVVGGMEMGVRMIDVGGLGGEAVESDDADAFAAFQGHCSRIAFGVKAIERAGGRAGGGE